MSSSHWVAAVGGKVPEGGVLGGVDHASQLWVARARHQGDLIPGKLVPSFGKCYLAWGGKEVETPEYEVLCNMHVDWVPVEPGKPLPYNALPVGVTSSGETLFSGRVQVQHTSQLGKVQPSHGVCYVPYGGQELTYKHFEILVVK